MIIGNGNETTSKTNNSNFGDKEDENSYGVENGNMYKNAHEINGTISRQDGTNINWSIKNVIIYWVKDNRLSSSGQYYYAVDINISNNNNDLCSDEGNKTKKVCDHCKNFVNDVGGILYDVHTEKLIGNIQAFTPYINKVSNHWFRNVYFSKAGMIDGKDNIIENDDEYEKKTGERWTLYEMHDNADNDSRQYEMYVYMKDEETGQYSSEFARDPSENYIVCVEVKDGEGDFKQSDVESGTYVKNDSGNFKLQILKENEGTKQYDDYTEELPNEFKVGKKAKIKSDVDWKGDNDSVYKLSSESKNSGWKTLEITEDLKNGKEELFSMDGIKVEYQYDAKGEVKQVEDGFRGETNPNIKKLFLDNYYLYDGTRERALLIQAAKDIIKNDNDNKNRDKDSELDPDDPDSFESLDESDEEKTGMIGNDSYLYKLAKNGKTEITVNTKEKDKDVHYKATIDELSGSVNILKNSLSAFSILKNMHTLDAEYIYHDFKELIVELDYFDKEDLVEEEDEVMVFPVPKVSSAGWPQTRYDKSENYHGTLIHSSEDYSKKEAETAAELSKYGIDLPTTNSNYSSEGTSTPSTNVEIIANEGERFDWSKVDGLSESQKCILQAAEDIQLEGYKKGWIYSTSSEELKNTFEDDKKGVCCSTLITFVCKACGIEYTSSHNANENANLLRAIDGVQEITDKSQLQPGDFVVHSDNGKGSGTGHIQIYAGKNSDGKDIWYNWGANNYINKEDQPQISTYTGWERIIRVTGLALSYNGIQGSASSGSGNATFAGYEGGEPVVAPVTGEVEKYGIVKRKNIETGQDGQEVGFIIIKVLNQGKPGEECTEFGGSHKKIDNDDVKQYKEGSLNASDWLNDKYTEEQLEKLGYDYFWEEYNYAGITGYKLCIEGFDISKITTGTDRTGKNIEDLKTYIENSSDNYDHQYEVPNLLDDNKEFELNVEEEAKKKAAFVIDQENDQENRKIFIKEGAVIGYTYTAEDAKAKGLTQEVEVEVIDDQTTTDENQSTETTTPENTDATEKSTTDEIFTTTKKYNIGNYMKITFKDTDHEFIENVEDYIETGKGGSKEGVYGDLENIDENSTDAEKIRAAVSYFVEEGFSMEAACGILGNLIQEHSLTTSVNEDGKRFGLVQWSTTDNRGKNLIQWLTDNGYNQDSFAGQIRSIYECEFNQMSQENWEELKSLTDVEKAAELFCVYFERCVNGSDEPIWYKTGNLYQELVERKIYSHNAYDIYMGDDSKGIKDK